MTTLAESGIPVDAVFEMSSSGVENEQRHPVSETLLSLTTVLARGPS